MNEADNSEQAGFSIGVAARMTGINSHTLRMWERRYQLGPSKRRGNRREYTATDIDHLRLIKKLVDKGMRIGDIAQLPKKTLSSLLLEHGGQRESDNMPDQVRTLVVGITLCNYFRQHLKRYPRLQLELHETDANLWLTNRKETEDALYIVQFDSVSKRSTETLLAISQAKRHVIVIYHYAASDCIRTLEHAGIIMLRGAVVPELIDDAIHKVLRLFENFSVLEQSGREFDIGLPAEHPRQFRENELIDAEKLANKLNCECPPHLTDLIRRLSAFEEYSKTCGAENWKQAAIHACIYAYTNQARFFIEKALQAVLDE